MRPPQRGAASRSLAALLTLPPLLSAVIGCDRGASQYSKNVLLITLDAARQQNLSLFGYERETSPNIDSLGEQGIAFHNIIPTGCSTKASLTSLFTAIDYRYHHLIEHNSPLPGDYETLAEVFRKNGYMTVGFSASRMVAKELNYDQGFAIYNAKSEGQPYVRSATIAGRFREFLEGYEKVEDKRPFFGYLHFEEPHPPWYPPSPWDLQEEYETRPMNRGCAYVPNNRAFRAVTAEKRQRWVDRYDGAIFQADQQIGGIIDRLREMGLLEDTVIAITTDHGLELFERYSSTHGRNPYDEVTKSFLVLWDGAVQEWPQEEELAGVQGRIFDVGPTLLGRAGIPIPEQWQGIDLLTSSAELPEIAFTTGYETTAVRAGRYKLVHIGFSQISDVPAWIGEYGFKLYDLEADPGEQVDVKKSRQKVFRRLLDEYQSYQEDLGREFVLGTTLSLSDDTVDQLRALGYIE